MKDLKQPPALKGEQVSFAVFRDGIDKLSQQHRLSPCDECIYRSRSSLLPCAVNPAGAAIGQCSEGEYPEGYAKVDLSEVLDKFEFYDFVIDDIQFNIENRQPPGEERLVPSALIKISAFGSQGALLSRIFTALPLSSLIMKLGLGGTEFAVSACAMDNLSFSYPIRNQTRFNMRLLLGPGKQSIVSLFTGGTVTLV